MVAFGFLYSLLLAAAPIADAEALFEANKDAEGFALVEREARSHDGEWVEYLAWCYDQGRGTKRDSARAVPLFREAASKGRRYAQWRLGVKLDEGDGTKADPDEAISWFRKAAAQNSPKAFASLGVMYASGRGVKQDFAQSMDNYRKSAELGEPGGFFGVALLHGRGEGVAVNLPESFAWMLVAATLGDQRALSAINKDQAFHEVNGQLATIRAQQIADEFKLNIKVKFDDRRKPASKRDESLG